MSQGVYALISSGTVTNLAVFDINSAPSNWNGEEVIRIDNQTPGISVGFTYASGTWTAPTGWISTGTSFSPPTQTQ